MKMLFQSEWERQRIDQWWGSLRTFRCVDKDAIGVTDTVNLLVVTAFSVGFLHTLLGPDHYIPFVAMSRCNRWSARKTVLVTSLCGFGHVLGSLLIGSIGLLLGTALFRLEALESFRVEGAAWLLIGFGMAYLTWGLVHAARGTPHTHLHAHADGTIHSHPHRHDVAHQHLHHGVEIGGDDAESDVQSPGYSITPWILFLIFAFGPCEALIPLLMYPAAESNLTTIMMVVTAFTLATLGTMIATVMLMVFGLRVIRFPDLHRFGHAISGLAILICGALVKSGL